MPIILAISGKAGVGKTTTANIILEELVKSNSHIKLIDILPFARGVKYVAKQSFGWDGNKDEKGRELLIGVGNTGRNYFPEIWADKSLKAIKSDSHTDLFLIDDWRYPNEIKYLEDNLPTYTIIKIRIEAYDRESLKGTRAYDDISENSLPSCLYWNDDYEDPPIVSNYGDYYDIIIDNSQIKNPTLEDLTRLIKSDLLNKL